MRSSEFVKTGLRRAAPSGRGCAARLRAWLSVLAVLLLLGGWATVSRGQQAPDPRPWSITVVMDDNYPPFVFRDSTGQLQGILKDTWALWQAHTGITVHLQAMDWARAQQVMQSGQADVIDAIFVTEARQRLYDFTAPYAALDVPIFFHQSISGIVNADSLKGFAVGVKDGDACIEVLRQHGIDSMKKFPSYTAVIAAAGAGEVRVFCAAQPPALYLLNKLGIEKEFRRSVPLYTGEFHRAVRKDNTALLRVLEEGFGRITAAERQQIEQKWYGAAIEGPGLLRHARALAYAMLSGALLAAVLVAWNLSLRRRVAGRTAELQRSVQALSAARGLAEAALAQLHAMLDAIPDLLFELDIEGRYHDYRAGRVDLLAAPVEQLLGRTVHDVMPQEAAQAVIDALHEAAAKGTSTGGQLRLDLPSGEHWFELSVARKRGGGEPGDRFIVLSRDITDRKRAEQALARHSDELELVVQERSRELVVARDAALAASRAKSEFLSRMSHELRTPLNAIMGFSQLLALDRTLSSRSQQFVKETVSASEHLLDLINDVLDLAQVESGRIALAFETLSVDELGREVLMLMQPLADLRKMAMQCSALQGWAVRADRTRLKQVLVNLLSNAIKYNRAAGSVTLDAAALDERTVRISVRDTGLGIAPEHLARVFEPFNRLGAESGPIEGTGIGLSICQRLAESMGGRIGVSSVVGRGSEFWVDLPRERAGPAGPEAADAGAGSAAVSARSLEAKVLYVEDNPVNMRLMQTIIERHDGLQLLGATSAATGLELARAQQPDLILLDITLPDMDGYALMARLRAEAGTRGIPVVAVTAKAMPSDAEKVRDAGFDEYLTKPIDLKVIDAVLVRMLSRGQSAEARPA